MKVFPSPAKEQTFSLVELASAIELVQNQCAIFNVHTQATQSLPNFGDDLGNGSCPACIFHAHKASCYICSTQTTESGIDFDESLSDTSATDSINVAPTLVNPALGPTPIDAMAVTPPTNNAAPALINPAVTQQASTSTSACWYVITVGHVTKVFQGWHNVYVHVVGVPGACFVYYSSLTSAQAAYGQALDDGTVAQVPL